MVSRAALLYQALALTASANVMKRAGPLDPVCAQVQIFAPAFPTQTAQAQSFCSSYFNIQTSTTTTVQTIAESDTSTLRTATSTTVYPTSTSYVSTQTCYTPSATPAPRKRDPEAGLVPKAAPVLAIPGFAAVPNPANAPISTACSCFGVNFSPSATATSLTTSTTYIATTTVYTTTFTSTAPATTTTATFTVFVPPSGTYVSSDGSTFTEYNGHDFYGNDLYSGYCGVGSGNGGSVSTPAGTFPCNGFNQCQDACSSYNDANLAAGSPNQTCVAASYAISSTFCYLKYAINDCSPVVNSNVNSGLERTQA